MEAPIAPVAPIKPGYKTTEFWLTAAATIMGLILASGAIGEGGAAERIAGVVCSMLGALGYSVSRGQAKR